MRITIIFPGRPLETGRATASVMPLSLTLLASLTPDRHEVHLVDMFLGDEVDYAADTDLVAITVRTPLATIAYDIADRFRRRGRPVVLGGPHVFACPEEAKEHADAVALGEGETLWPRLLADQEQGTLREFYVSGPYDCSQLPGTVHHEPERPDLVGLPMMRRDLLPRDRYAMDSLFTTRGCPNHCRFCPVTNIFGGKIRHRPIDEVVAEVETLGPRYYNVDDSVFGHPQVVDRPEENRYYLDLYRELARMRPQRQWTGAGGVAAVSYPDGQRILELAAESGLSAIAAGLEAVTAHGQLQSGAWRKLHFKSPSTFNLETMKDQIRTIQGLGIEVRGFFVIGWDDDTVETYYRTLDFCDELGITPFIFTLTPMPGSDLYEEYLERGRIERSLPWSSYGIGRVVFSHPTMTAKEMITNNARVMERGYSRDRILERTMQATRFRPGMATAQSSYHTQVALGEAYAAQYAEILAELED